MPLFFGLTDLCIVTCVAYDTAKNHRLHPAFGGGVVFIVASQALRFIARSFRLIAETIDVIENDAIYRTTIPKCEPQLGKRGLYNAAGGGKDVAAAEMAMLWVLNLCDGTHSLLDIAERADLPFAVVHHTAQLLCEHGLLVTATFANRT